MKKQELVKGIAGKMDVTQKQAGEFLEAFEKTVIEGLVEDGKVQMVGFLTLEVKDTKERKGYNIHTEEPMIIPAGKRVSCRVGQPVKDIFK